MALVCKQLELTVDELSAIIERLNSADTYEDFCRLSDLYVLPEPMKVEVDVTVGNDVMLASAKETQANIVKRMANDNKLPVVAKHSKIPPRKAQANVERPLMKAKVVDIKLCKYIAEGKACPHAKCRFRHDRK
jgi:hypothetical protein